MGKPVKRYGDEGRYYVDIIRKLPVINHFFTVYSISQVPVRV
ncbi:MAG: hypothetical protein RXR39_03080 [Caldivirga sp.]